MYVFAEMKAGDFTCSPRLYSTPEGARRAARRRGYSVLPRTYQGHNAAKRRLEALHAPARS